MFLIRTGAIDGFQSLATDCGCNPMELLNKVGLNYSQLRNPNTYVAYSKVADLLELAAEACDEPLFGLRLADRQTSSVLGDLPLTVSQLPSLGDALSQIDKDLYLHARGAHLSQTRRGENVVVEVEIDIPSSRGILQLMQMSVGHVATFIEETLDLPAPGFPLLLRQNAPPLGSSALDGDTLARVAFGTRYNGVRIPASWLQRKPRYDEAALQAHFQEYLKVLQRRYPDNLHDQVRDIIGRILPSGECSLERVAAALDLHQRVLQMRLKQSGSSFTELLKESRLEIAEQHLRHRSMAITDLALRLGYADVSVFSRNFKRWTGLSPSQWQKLHSDR